MTAKPERVVIVIDLGQCDEEKLAEIEANAVEMRRDIPKPEVQSITIARDKQAQRVMKALRAPW